jgi:hypothetical protein
MKIAEVLKESKYDDWEDEDEVVSDPDHDKIPHIVMQLKKAVDVGGNYPITFKDGKKFKIPMNVILAFIRKYSELKPMDREEMQSLAAKSKDDFVATIQGFNRTPAPRSIYK